jgi:hypothetical protein
MIYIFTLDDTCTPEQGSAIHDSQQVVMYGKFVYGGNGNKCDKSVLEKNCWLFMRGDMKSIVQ